MRVIITGATGMVGKGVLLECLEDKEVTEVLSISRRKLEMIHPKLNELIHEDFTDFSSVLSKFQGFDACFHCMGVSSMGKNEEEFSKLTFGVTKSLADTCFTANKNMVFNYVSGMGSDSSETSKTMWARVKGKTENYVLNKGFKDAYAFRPGMIIPEKGVKSSTSWYSWIYSVLQPFYPLMKKLNNITTTSRIGSAMLILVNKGQQQKHLVNKDINLFSKN